MYGGRLWATRAEGPASVWRASVGAAWWVVQLLRGGVLIDADFPQRKHFLSLIIGKVTMYKVVQELYNIRTIYVQYTYKIVQLAAL